MRMLSGAHVIATRNIANGDVPAAVPQGTRGTVVKINSSILVGERYEVLFDNAQRVEVGAESVSNAW